MEVYVNNYTVTTKMTAVAKALSALEGVYENNLPIVDSDGDLELLTVSLLARLGMNEYSFDLFFNAITGQSNVKFSEELNDKEAKEIAFNFFGSIDSAQVRLIELSLKESKKQKHLVLKEAMIEMTTKIMNEEKVKASDTQESLEASENQD